MTRVEPNGDGTATIYGSPVMRRFSPLTADGTGKRYGIDVPVYTSVVDASWPTPARHQPAWDNCEMWVIVHWDQWGAVEDFDWRFLGGYSQFNIFGFSSVPSVFANTVSRETELYAFTANAPGLITYQNMIYPPQEMDVLDFADRAVDGPASDGSTRTIPGTDIPGDPFYNINSFWGDSYVWAVERRGYVHTAFGDAPDQLHPGCYLEISWSPDTPRNNWEWGGWYALRAVKPPPLDQAPAPVFVEVGGATHPAWQFDDRETRYSEYVMDATSNTYTAPPGPTRPATGAYPENPPELEQLILRWLGPFVFRMVSRFELMLLPSVTVPTSLTIGEPSAGARRRTRVLGHQA